jgi:hypothetical protein
MKRDFSQLLKGYDDNQIIDGATEKPMTLGSACIEALNGIFEDEKNLSGEAKFKRHQLCARIYKGGEVDVTAEEISLMKLLVGKGYPPIVVGAVYKLFEDEKVGKK